jgi:high-affinity K+ transport system ATPase subunit B
LADDTPEGSIVELAGQAGCCRINYQLKVCFNQNYSQKLELRCGFKDRTNIRKVPARCSKKYFTKQLGIFIHKTQRKSSDSSNGGTPLVVIKKLSSRCLLVQDIIKTGMKNVLNACAKWNQNSNSCWR